MDLRRISSPLNLYDKLSVVSIEEVKAQARVMHSTEDDLIASYIEAAFDYLHGPDGWLNGYCLLQETYEFYPVWRGEAVIELPLRPLASDPVLEFQRRASDGSYTGMDTALYYVMAGDAFPAILRPRNAIWPAVANLDCTRAYRVQMTAGHVDGASVPAPIRLAMKMLAAHWFANREAVGPDGRAIGEPIHFGLKNLCGRYRLAHDHS